MIYCRGNGKIVQSVGRLDFNSEGLIFLTNDGQFALRLTHPRYGVRKKYLATVEGEVTPAMLQRFTRGVFHEGERLKALAARIISGTPRRAAWWNWNWARAKTAKCGGCLNRRA